MTSMIRISQYSYFYLMANFAAIAVLILAEPEIMFVYEGLSCHVRIICQVEGKLQGCLDE